MTSQTWQCNQSVHRRRWCFTSLLHWRIPLTIATDEADTALDHQRNGFTGVLKQAEKIYSPLRKTRQETSVEIKHSALLVRRISTHTSAHAHASVHTFMCVRVCGEGGCSTQLLLGDGTFCFSLSFVWAFQKSLGCKVCVVYVGWYMYPFLGESHCGLKIWLSFEINNHLISP